jgi:hypothetical protein
MWPHYCTTPTAALRVAGRGGNQQGACQVVFENGYPAPGPPDHGRNAPFGAAQNTLCGPSLTNYGIEKCDPRHFIYGCFTRLQRQDVTQAAKIGQNVKVT